MKKRKKIFIIIPLILVLIIPIVFLFFFGGYAVYENVSYGEGNEEVVDIYIPHSAKNNEVNGCVLFIHGGSWSSGDKKDKSLMCGLVANKGYVTATLNYTLFSEETADSYNVWIVMEQISKAFLKIQQFCAEKGVNVTMGATSGYSAGGHLAMLYAYSQAEKPPFKMAFTASLAGPADFSNELWGDLYLGIASRLSGEDLSGKSQEEIALIANSFAPVNFITESAPPTLLAYGGRDELVLAKNGESVLKKCQQLGVECEYLLFKNSSHSMITDVHMRVKHDKLLIQYCRTYFGYQ